MSYVKIMKWQRTHRKGTKQPVLFSTLANNERRKIPWFGSWAIDPENAEQLKLAVNRYDQETVRLLDENPNLKLV